MESLQDKSTPSAQDEVEETTGHINRMDIALQNDIRHAAARYYDPDIDDRERSDEEEDFFPPSPLHFTFRRAFRNLERGLQGPKAFSSEEHFDLFEVHPRKYAACTSVVHFQLCHQVWYHSEYFQPLPEYETCIFFVYRNQIKTLNWLTKEQNVVMTLSHSPQNMTVAYGYVATCGSSGQVDILNLTSKTTLSERFDNTLNNCVHISPFKGEIRLYVCSNARSIGVYTLGENSASFIHVIPFSIALNFCSVSPNGNTMIAVGDSPEVFIINVNQEEETYPAQYTLIDTLLFPAVFPTSEDAPIMSSNGCGFSISWNKKGTLFAVAQQYPGKVAVWGWPGKQLLHLLDMSYPGNECRSVHFFEPEGSQANILMFVEKTEHVHFVDLDKRLRQTLTLPFLLTRNYSPSPSQISGAAITKRGQVFVGRSGGIYEYHLVGLRSLKETCTRFIRAHLKIWPKEKLTQSLPMDVLEHIIPQPLSNSL
jgi:hypothetical protein